MKFEDCASFPSILARIDVGRYQILMEVMHLASSYELTKRLWTDRPVNFHSRSVKPLDSAVSSTKSALQ